MSESSKTELSKLPVEWTDAVGDDVRLYRGDCREVLAFLAADAVISDPPYGMDWDTDTTRFSGGHNAGVRLAGRNDDRPVSGDNRPFDPSPWLSFPRVVLWGFHHFADRLPRGSSLVWIKRNDAAFGSFLSDAELAWMKGGCGVYCRRDLSMNAEASRRVHPCQKPVGLMKWCIELAKVPAGGVILDPYMGSGTTGIAALQMGYRFIGIESDPDHYATALRRLTHCAGADRGQLFAGVA